MRLACAAARPAAVGVGSAGGGPQRGRQVAPARQVIAHSVPPHLRHSQTLLLSAPADLLRQRTLFLFAAGGGDHPSAAARGCAQLVHGSEAGLALWTTGRGQARYGTSPGPTATRSLAPRAGRTCDQGVPCMGPCALAAAPWWTRGPLIYTRVGAASNPCSASATRCGRRALRRVQACGPPSQMVSSFVEYRAVGVVQPALGRGDVETGAVGVRTGKRRRWRRAAGGSGIKQPVGCALHCSLRGKQRGISASIVGDTQQQKETRAQEEAVVAGRPANAVQARHLGAAPSPALAGHQMIVSWITR